MLLMKSLDPEWQKMQFIRKGNSVEAWTMSAYPLLAGARVLEKNNNLALHDDDDDVLPDEVCTMPAMFLLYGFALESLLKACYLKRGGSFIFDKKFKSIDKIAMHNLVDLANAAELPLSPSESDALKKLSVQIVSFARYPIGKKFESEMPIEISNNRMASPKSFNSGDVEILEGVVKKIGGILGRDFSNSSLGTIAIKNKPITQS